MSLAGRPPRWVHLRRRHLPAHLCQTAPSFALLTWGGCWQVEASQLRAALDMAAVDTEAAQRRADAAVAEGRPPPHMLPPHRQHQSSTSQGRPRQTWAWHDLTIASTFCSRRSARARVRGRSECGPETAGTAAGAASARPCKSSKPSTTTVVSLQIPISNPSASCDEGAEGGNISGPWAGQRHSYDLRCGACGAIEITEDSTASSSSQVKVLKAHLEEATAAVAVADQRCRQHQQSAAATARQAELAEQEVVSDGGLELHT